MTGVGVDVRARCSRAAAIDVVSGGLGRMRFGVGAEDVVGWSSGLAAAVRAAYEAGLPGFGGAAGLA